MVLQRAVPAALAAAVSVAWVRAAWCQQILLDQLPWDGGNASRSIQFDGPFPSVSARTADDALLPLGDGGRWHITRLSAVLLVQGAVTPASGSFEVYADSGAFPFAPADEPPLHIVQSTDAQFLGTAAGYGVWLIAAGDNSTTLFTRPAGQRLWVSAFLRTLNPADDAYLGVHSISPPLNGSTAWFRDDGTPRPAWVSLDDCCGEPADSAIRIEGSQRPPNDDCPNAVPLVPAATPFDTSGATTDGPAESVCVSGTGIGAWPRRDIWFTYTAPTTLGACAGNGTGPLTFSLCGSSFDTSLAVYLASCPTAGAAIACSDDAPGCGDGLRSSVTITATAGAAYLLRIGGVSEGAAGTGQGVIDVSVDPRPPNDLCSQSLPLLAGTFQFCNIGGTTQFFAPEDQQCGFSGFPEADVWYQYTATAAGPVTIEVCGDGIQPRLLVYVGGCPVAGAGGGVLVSCGSHAASGCGPGNGIARQRFIGPAGVTYLLRVGVNASATGRGELRIFCPGDFNRTGTTSAQDIFDFLAAFFAGSGDADFDGTPGISLQDLFDFLAAYFTACP